MNQVSVPNQQLTPSVYTSQDRKIPTILKGGDTPTNPLFSVHCGPEGPGAGAKRTHAAEGREGEHSETVVLETTD